MATSAKGVTCGSYTGTFNSGKQAPFVGGKKMCSTSASKTWTPVGKRGSKPIGLRG